jgi:hypothetical protein
LDDSPQLGYLGEEVSTVGRLRSRLFTLCQSTVRLSGFWGALVQVSRAGRPPGHEVDVARNFMVFFLHSRFSRLRRGKVWYLSALFGHARHFQHNLRNQQPFSSVFPLISELQAQVGIRFRHANTNMSAQRSLEYACIASRAAIRLHERLAGPRVHWLLGTVRRHLSCHAAAEAMLRSRLFSSFPERISVR